VSRGDPRDRDHTDDGDHGRPSADHDGAQRLPRPWTDGLVEPKIDVLVDELGRCPGCLERRHDLADPRIEVAGEEELVT
jgi:hypothetical protein